MPEFLKEFFSSWYSGACIFMGVDMKGSKTDPYWTLHWEAKKIVFSFKSRMTSDSNLDIDQRFRRPSHVLEHCLTILTAPGAHILAVILVGWHARQSHNRLTIILMGILCSIVRRLHFYQQTWISATQPPLATIDIWHERISSFYTTYLCCLNDDWHLRVQLCPCHPPLFSSNPTQA